MAGKSMAQRAKDARDKKMRQTLLFIAGVTYSENAYSGQWVFKFPFDKYWQAFGQHKTKDEVEEAAWWYISNTRKAVSVSVPYSE